MACGPQEAHDHAVFVDHLPAAALRPFVAAAHGYQVPAMPTGVHRGLPSRHLTLVVELAAPLRVSGLSGSVAAHGVVGGLHTTPALIDASLPQEGVQYALTPWGAQALLGLPAAELRGRTVDLEDLLGGAVAGDLVERLVDAADWGRRFALLDAALLQRLCSAPERSTEIPGQVTEAWRTLVRSRGTARVSAVAERVGWGRRHLSERFRLATGLTPKEAARVIRFEAARARLLASDRPALADVAVQCGYADQQHLAREWRDLAGCSIRAWLREELPFVHDSSDAGPEPWPA
jgi:AraC-like DNA-binding protein